MDTLVGWATLNPATAFWAALGLFTTTAAAAGVAFSRTFRQSCSDFAAARWQEAKDVARLVAYVLIAPYWIVRLIQRGCQQWHPRLQRFDRYYLLDQHRFAIGAVGVLTVSGFVWATCAVLGVQLPHSSESTSQAVLLTSAEDWQSGKLDGVQTRNGNLELRRVSGGEWKAISVPVADYTDILPMGNGTALLAVDLMPYVVYYDGHQEHREGLPKGEVVRFLAKADGRVFGFGNDGRILERRDGTWVGSGSPIVPNYAGTAYTMNEIVAGGGGGFITHYTHGEWFDEALPITGTSTGSMLVAVLDDGTFVAAAGREVFYRTAGRWQAVTPVLTADRADGPISIIGVAGENITKLVLATSTQILRRKDGGWQVDETPLASCPPPDGNMVSIGDALWYGASVGQSVRLLDGAWTTIPLPNGSQGIANLRADGKDIWGIARQTLGAQVLRFQDEVRYVDHGTAVYRISANVPAWSHAELRSSTPARNAVHVEYSTDRTAWAKDPPQSGTMWIRVTLGSNDKTKTPSVQLLKVEPASAARS